MNITYVLVEVTGVEDEDAAVAAIDNLSNGEQQFAAYTTTVVNVEEDPMLGLPVIYFP